MGEPYALSPRPAVVFTHKGLVVRYVKSILFKKFYDGEGGDGSGGNSPPPPPPPPAGTFTQEQVNAFLAKEKKAWEAKQKQTVDALKELQAKDGTSAARIAELEEQIQSIEKQYLSKDELAKKEAEKEAQKQKKLFDDTVAEKQLWQANYNQLLVENEIRAASTKYDAWKAEQLITQLGGKTKVVPVLAEGKPTGKYQVIVTIPGDEGKILEVSVDEAVKYMKSKPEEYGNFFKANVSGGIGGSNNGGTGANGVDMKRAATDPEYYRQNRSKITNG